MSNKSGTSSQVISLPKGGGALHGLSETFSPDPHTGTGNFTIPITLPSGRNDFQPDLKLVYSTGNGNGLFGLGWSLSVPGVSRKTSKGVPRYDATDTFILSGAEDLVPVGGEDGAIRYRPRTEGLFARITHVTSGKNDYWQVESKDGLKSFYGTPRPDGAPEDWSDLAVVRNPDSHKQRQIFAGKLTQTRDPFGNVIQYDYELDAGDDGTHTWRQPLLKHIHYVDYKDAGESRFLVTVTFDYKERPDPFSDYRAGFEVRTTQRCAKVTISTHAGEERVARIYHLVYHDQLPLQALPLNGVSLLSQVSVEGRDGDTSEALPPLAFGYTTFEPHDPERRRFTPVSGAEMPARSLASADLELADLIGDGLPDILEMNGTVRYWRNLGDGRFDRPRVMRDAPPHALADPGVQLIDANGDGRIDLLVTSEILAGYYEIQHDGAWSRRSFQRYRAAPSFNLEDPEVKLVDLDGDGVTDAIRAGSRMECFFNDARAGWMQRPRVVERQALDVFPNVSFADPRVKWGDMSGGGLQDIVLVHDVSVEYWPNLGHGSWGRRVRMGNSPRFPYGYDPKHILLGDVDGDGLADLLYVDNRQVTVWINQSGNGWSAPIPIRGTPAVTDIDAVRLVDLYGSGVAGVLWSTDASGPARHTLYFLDLTGGAKPYLLHEMDNHRCMPWTAPSFRIDRTPSPSTPTIYAWRRDRRRARIASGSSSLIRSSSARPNGSAAAIR